MPGLYRKQRGRQPGAMKKAGLGVWAVLDPSSSTAPCQPCDLCADASCHLSRPVAHRALLLALGLWPVLSSQVGLGRIDSWLEQCPPCHAPPPVLPALHITSVSPSHQAPNVCHFLRSLQSEAKCTLDNLLEVLKLDKASQIGLLGEGRGV